MDDAGLALRSDVTATRVAYGWENLGLMWVPDGRRPWQVSHAQNPVALPLDDTHVRVFVSTRDQQQRSHASWFDLELGARPRIVAEGETPALAPGLLGHFDDHGVYLSSVVRDGERLLGYYAGWNPGPRAPLFHAAIGLAVSTDGGHTFLRESAAPILARSSVDPWMVSAPCVRREATGWRMWYVSGLRWEEQATTLVSFYDVKLAISDDGHRWTPTGETCFPLMGAERNIARPTILGSPEGYRAWFPVSDGRGYRIASSTSSDGIAWQRDTTSDAAQVPAQDWDSDAQAYPHVWVQAGRTWMLYNGNGLGRGGVGLAVAAA